MLPAVQHHMLFQLNSMLPRALGFIAACACPWAVWYGTCVAVGNLLVALQRAVFHNDWLLVHHHWDSCSRCASTFLAAQYVVNAAKTKTTKQ